MTRREIKFRAYDKEEKAFLMPETADGMSITLRGVVGHRESVDEDDYGVIQNGRAYWPEQKFITEIYELNQYTGLKDRSGRDIYEGDIIRIENINRSWKNTPIIDWKIFEVKWNVYTWAFSNDALYMPMSSYDTTDATEFDIEILGNVYENPELLNQIK